MTEKNTNTKKAPTVKKETTPTKEVAVEKAGISSLDSLVADIKKKAFFKRIVTISYNDKRDSDITSTAYLTCENQYFSLAKVVPLNTPVELEQCLIDNAEEARYQMHVPEVKDGQRTGLSMPTLARKYNVHYEVVK